MGLGRMIATILSPTTHNHYVECPVCGDSFRTQALYEQHYYQDHADGKRFNAE